MPKDKFKIVYSKIAPIEPEDPLKDLKETASFLLDVEKIEDSQQFDKDLDRSGIIEINGRIVWDSQEQTEEIEKLKQRLKTAEESEKRKIEKQIELAEKKADKRKEKVKKVFKKFKQEKQKVKEKALFNLHQGTMAGAWLMLNRNYELNHSNGTKIKGIFGVADSLKELSIRRQGDVFKYELKVPAYVIRDEKSGDWWGIGPSGNLEKVDVPDSDMLKEQGYKPICEIFAIAKVDLTQVPPNTPVASFEVEIQSDRPEFRYKGPKTDAAFEVFQLENINFLDRVRKAFSSFLSFKSKKSTVKKGEKQIHPSKKDGLTGEVEMLERSEFLMALQIRQENITKKYDNIIVEELSTTDQYRGGIKIEVVDDDGLVKEFLNHFQNQEQVVESNLSVNPSYKSIAILFDLNDGLFPLEMDPCGDVDSLIRIFKAAKFANKEIQFSQDDLALLKTTSEYQNVKKLDQASFREYLANQGELKIFLECFSKKEKREKFLTARKDIIFDDISKQGKKRKALEFDEQSPQNRTNRKKK